MKRQARSGFANNLGELSNSLAERKPTIWTMGNLGGVGKAMAESRKGCVDSLVVSCVRWLDGRLTNSNVILNGTIHTRLQM